MQDGPSTKVRTLSAPGGPGQDEHPTVQQRADKAGLHRAFVAYGAELTGLARRVLGSHHLAEEAGQVRTTKGGNDYHTWLFDGPGAEQAAIAFTAAVIALARPGWVVTPTAHPKFYR